MSRTLPYRILLGMVFTWFSLSSMAQDGGNINKSFVEEIELNIELDSAERMHEPIEQQARKIEIEPQKYYISDFQLRLGQLNPKIKIFTVEPTPPPKLYGNYVRAGIGNYLTPYAEVFVNSKENAKWMYGLHLKHLSSARGAVDKENSSTSVNKSSVYAQRIFSKSSLKSEVYYVRNRYNYYGYPESILSVNRDTIKQVYNKVGTRIVFDHFNTDAKVLSPSELNVSYLTNYWSNSEFDASLLSKPSFALNSDAKITAEMGVYVSQLSQRVSLNRNFVSFKPLYEARQGMLSYQAGLQVNHQNDTLGGKKSLHVYPVLNAEYTLNEKRFLKAYGGFDGGMERLTLGKLIVENPFLDTNQVVSNTNNTLRLFAGIKGNLSSYFNFNTLVAYKSYKNLYFFTNSVADPAAFRVQYDNADLVYLKGELSYQRNRQSGALIRGEYFGYTPSTLKYAYHRPSFVGTFSAHHVVKNKWMLSSDLELLGGIKAYDFRKNEQKSLPFIADLSVKVDYRLNSKLSTFIELNNILSQKYQRYLYYKSQGINFLVGLTYSF